MRINKFLPILSKIIHKEMLLLTKVQLWEEFYFMTKTYHQIIPFHVLAATNKNLLLATLMWQVQELMVQQEDTPCV